MRIENRGSSGKRGLQSADKIVNNLDSSSCGRCLFFVFAWKNIVFGLRCEYAVRIHLFAQIVHIWLNIIAHIAADNETAVKHFPLVADHQGQRIQIGIPDFCGAFLPLGQQPEKFFQIVVSVGIQNAGIAFCIEAAGLSAVASPSAVGIYNDVPNLTGQIVIATINLSVEDDTTADAVVQVQIDHILVIRPVPDFRFGGCRAAEDISEYSLLILRDVYSKVKGTVFDIKELAVFDGPGIRTTVFLKGCPLKCSWCHNPEGQAFGPELMVSENGCKHCGECLKACSHPDGCTACGSCVRACPMGLRRIYGTQMEPEALAEKLLKNADYLNRQGRVERRGGLMAGIIQGRTGCTDEEALAAAEAMEAQLQASGKAENADANFRIVGQGWGNWVIEEGLTATEDFITANPDVNVILGENDQMLFGSIKALENASLTGVALLAAADGACDAYDLIKENGTADNPYVATGLNSPVLVGRVGMDVANQIVVDGAAWDSFDKITETEAAAITVDNVDDYYDIGF